MPTEMAETETAENSCMESVLKMWKKDSETCFGLSEIKPELVKIVKCA